MFYGVDLPDGSPAAIIVGRDTEARLSKTCFRGPSVARAGNFFSWRNCEVVLTNPKVLSDLLADALEVIEGEEGNGRASVTISLDREIGWESTAPRRLFKEDDLEWFAPNRKSRAERVKLDRLHLRAPRTSDLTIVYQVRLVQGRGWAIQVWSIYPGEDIGEVRGNITREEGRVFFDWNHPGT